MSEETEKKQTRDNLKIVYGNYHDEVWKRGENIWLVNSILITGSLIAAFELPLVSLFLVIIAVIMQVTSDKVTRITYNTMHEIEIKLGIEMLGEVSPNSVFNKIKSKWWYPIRSLTSYFIYAFLIISYSAISIKLLLDTL